eukprot:scaffold412_cov388-Prasinococcus_capsulatus_cf.AAC.4
MICLGEGLVKSSAVTPSTDLSVSAGCARASPPSTSLSTSSSAGSHMGVFRSKPSGGETNSAALCPTGASACSKSMCKGTPGFSAEYFMAHFRIHTLSRTSTLSLRGKVFRLRFTKSVCLLRRSSPSSVPTRSALAAAQILNTACKYSAWTGAGSVAIPGIRRAWRASSNVASEVDLKTSCPNSPVHPTTKRSAGQIEHFTVI